MLGERRVHLAPDGPTVLGQHHALHRRIAQVRRGGAGDLEPTGVGVVEDPVEVGVVDADGQRLGEGAEAQLAVAQGVDRAGVVVEVEQEERDGGRGVVGGREGDRGGEEPPPVALVGPGVRGRRGAGAGAQRPDHGVLVGEQRHAVAVHEQHVEEPVRGAQGAGGHAQDLGRGGVGQVDALVVDDHEALVHGLEHGRRHGQRGAQLALGYGGHRGAPLGVRSHGGVRRGRRGAAAGASGQVGDIVVRLLFSRTAVRGGEATDRG